MRRKRHKYNPQRPLGSWWKDLEEPEQIRLVENYHRRTRVRLPSIRTHALAHVMVENQIQLGDETPVAATLKRLKAEGLGRHDAVHAIGGVLMGIVWQVARHLDKAIQK